MSELETLIAEAELGEEARAFLQSDLCKCLLGMAKQEVDAAQQGLEQVDPSDINKVRELQNKAWRGRQFEAWLTELIMNGDQALALYRQQLKE